MSSATIRNGTASPAAYTASIRIPRPSEASYAARVNTDPSTNPMQGVNPVAKTNPQPAGGRGPLPQRDEHQAEAEHERNPVNEHPPAFDLGRVAARGVAGQIGD